MSEFKECEKCGRKVERLNKGLVISATQRKMKVPADASKSSKGSNEPGSTDEF